MNRRTYFLLIGSILGAASLSCHGPETGALAPRIAAEFDRSGSAQRSLDTEIPGTEIEAKAPESNQDRESRVERMRNDKELIMLVGLIDSLL
jgi:hypothetical protein